MKGLEASNVSSNALPTDFRFNAQFFQKSYLAEDQALHRHRLEVVGTFSFVADGPHGYHEVDDASPIAMLTAKCAANWFAERQGADTIAKWVDDANKRSSLELDDLILATRGTVGDCAIVTAEALPANLDQDVARIAINRDADVKPRYALCFFNSRFGQDHIARHATGMVQQGMSLAKVRDIPVPVLSQGFQQRVAEFVDRALSERRLGQQLQGCAQDDLMGALGLVDWAPPEPLTYSARASSACAAERLDPQYFMPAKLQVRRSLAASPGQLLSDRVDSIRDQWLPERAEPGTLVRNYDVTDALVPLLDTEKEPSAAEDIGSMKKMLKDGDVALSRLRAYLKEIAVVRTGDDIPSVGSSEFIVLRPKGISISPETLMVFLRSAPVQTILKWCQDGSQHPRFSESDLLAIPVPDVLAVASPTITGIVWNGFAARRRAAALLEAAKRAVEIAIEKDEAAALRFLDAAEA